MEVTIDLLSPPLPGPNKRPAITLSAAAFARKYAASTETTQKVRQVLRNYDLHIVGVDHGGRALRVAGKVAAMEAAFQPNMAMYRSDDQGEFRGRVGMIRLPVELDGLITGVFGLDQRRMARRRERPDVRKQKMVAAKTPTTPSPMLPAALEALYNFPKNDASQQVIAIAEFGVPVSAHGKDVAPTYFPADVTAFCSENKRPAPQVQILPVNISPLSPEQLRMQPADRQKISLEISGEVMMDIEIATTLAPGAKVGVYFATFDQKGWMDLLGQVTSGTPVTPVSVSISWGAPEDSNDWSDAARAAINDRLQAATMQGITVCVSAGDDGSGDASSKPGAHLDFPASSPFVLAVGGTMLDAGKQEVVWWEAPGQRDGKGGGATGGGVSQEFERPAWQNVRVKPLGTTGFDGRIIPDVAALAGPPLYALRLAGQSAPNGGTSASAPLWAALIARMNAALPLAKQQRFLTPLLYQTLEDGRTVGAAGCRDITVGGNTSSPNPGIGYEAQEGFDAVSGWGVPDGERLLAALKEI